MTTATPTYTHGRFVWHDLTTPSMAGAQEFYGKLLGWTFKSVETGPGQPAYALIQLGDRQIGGITETPAGSHFPPYWLGYVSVSDVDATADAAQAAGGRVAMGPAEIPHVGRFALLEDPQGGAVIAFKAVQGDVEAPERPGLGEFCWDRLNSTTPDASAAFYTRVFGWSAEAVPGSTNRMFRHGDLPTASLATMPFEGPAHWLTYLNVADLNESRARAEWLGAEILVDQLDVPGVGTLAIVRDPQRAVFCLFQAAG
jgi:predicted enzyme related to lactoylglutathione lyase